MAYLVHDALAGEGVRLLTFKPVHLRMIAARRAGLSWRSSLASGWRGYQSQRNAARSRRGPARRVGGSRGG